jgi:hypothetical protein
LHPGRAVRAGSRRVTPRACGSRSVSPTSRTSCRVPGHSRAPSRCLRRRTASALAAQTSVPAGSPR